MNCKPGMLARIVRNGEQRITPGILDRIVEVVRPCLTDEIFTSIDGRLFRIDRSDGPIWVVRSASPLPWMAISAPTYGKVAFFEERPIDDRYLRPIGGVPVHDEQRDEVPA